MLKPWIQRSLGGLLALGFFGAFLGFGLFAVREGHASLTQALRLLEVGRPAVGVVVDYRIEHDDGTRYFPIVTVTDSVHGTFRLESRFSVGVRAFDIGERVAILVDPDFAPNSRIHTFFQFWGGTVLLCGMGSVFTLIGAGPLLLGLYGLVRRRTPDDKAGTQQTKGEWHLPEGVEPTVRRG